MKRSTEFTKKDKSDGHSTQGSGLTALFLLAAGAAAYYYWPELFKESVPPASYDYFKTVEENLPFYEYEGKGKLAVKGSMEKGSCVTIWTGSSILPQRKRFKVDGKNHELYVNLYSVSGLKSINTDTSANNLIGYIPVRDTKNTDKLEKANIWGSDCTFKLADPAEREAQSASQMYIYTTGPYIVTASRLNVRLGESTSSQVIGSIPNGKCIATHDYHRTQRGGFLPVRVRAEFNGQTVERGYISSRYLREAKRSERGSCVKQLILD